MKTQATLGLAATVFSLLAVGLIGFAGAIYGPTLSAISAELGISAPVASIVVSAHGAGAFVAVAMSLSRSVEQRLQYRPAIALALIAAGAAAIASGAPVPFPFIGGFLIGLGYGFLTVGLNALFARSFGKHSDAMVNLLNTMFGVGAITAPAAFVMLDGVLATVYFGLALMALALAVPALLVDDRKPPETVTAIAESGYPILPFVVMFFAIGVEATVVGWGPTILISRNVAELDAASAASWFFVVYLAARLLAVVLSLYITCRVIFLGALIALTCLAAGAWMTDAPRAWFIAFGIVGFIFPNGFGWFAGALSGRSAVEARVILAALLGATLVTLAMSWLANRFGADALFIPITLTLAVTTVMALCVPGDQDRGAIYQRGRAT